MAIKYEMPPFLLCVDPGRISGVAMYSTNVGEEVTLEWSKELEFDETGNEINRTMYDHGRDLRVVCESFTITPQTGKNSDAPWSLELIGVTRWLSHRYESMIVMQTPQKAKNFCPNEMLKRLEIWHREGAGHARDALRHGVTHLVDCGWRPEKLLAD